MKYQLFFMLTLCSSGIYGMEEKPDIPDITPAHVEEGQSSSRPTKWERLEKGFDSLSKCHAKYANLQIFPYRLGALVLLVLSITLTASDGPSTLGITALTTSGLLLCSDACCGCLTCLNNQ